MPRARARTRLTTPAGAAAHLAVQVSETTPECPAMVPTIVEPLGNGPQHPPDRMERVVLSVSTSTSSRPSRDLQWRSAA